MPPSNRSDSEFAPKLDDIDVDFADAYGPFADTHLVDHSVPAYTFFGLDAADAAQPKSKSQNAGSLYPSTAHGTIHPATLSPSASDPDTSSDSSPSPNAMNNSDGDRDHDMSFFNESNNSQGWGDMLDLDGMSPCQDFGTINPAMIDQPMPHFSGALPPAGNASSPAFDSSSSSDSNSSPRAHNDSDESLPIDTKTSAFGYTISSQVPVPNVVRNKRHSSSADKASNGISANASRESSPMAQMVFSQGSSPFTNGEMSLPEMPSVATHAPLQIAGNPPMGSWFNVPVSGLNNGSVDGAATNGRAGPAQFSVMPTNRPAHIPTLKLIGMPPKSRVETQIHLKMTLHPVPDGIKKIRLPLHTISKPKFLVKPRPPPQPDTLELYTQLVCSSAMEKPNLRERAFARAATSGHPCGGLPSPDEDKTEDGGEVRICAGCVTREQKRANRKKNKKPDEDEDWKRHESHRVIVFNTHEIKELKSPEPEYSTAPGSMLIDIPMRIACYCRHHHEKQGFRVIFTLKDCQGRLVTQCLSPSIMITDDHKTPQSNSQSHGSHMETAEPAAASSGLNGSSDMNAIQPGIPFRQSQSTSDIQALKRSASALSAQPLHSGTSSLGTSALQTPRNLSRPASPGPTGPIAKKRKSSASKIPTTLTMTRIETPAFVAPPGIGQQNGLPRSSSATSPFSPSNSNPFTDGPSPASTYGQVVAPANQMFSAAVAPTTPNGNEQMLFQPDAIRTTAPESRAMSVMYSAPASSQNSRAPSPNAMMNGILPPQQLNQLSQVSQAIHNGVPMADSLQMAQFANTQRQQMASILKVLPNEGPTSGGIEVSILGSGFRQGQEVYFGDTKATTTTYWADSAITCILPPYHTTGSVPVSVRSSQGLMQSAPRQTAQFMYKDENQDQLAHLALGVLHHKLTGSIGDTKGFIQRILAAENGSANFSDGGSGGFSLNTLAMETQLLRMLDLMDIDDSLNRTKLDAKRKVTGHTMLHLSVALGYYRFTAALLVRGANPNARDAGGYTPLHYAALHNHAELVRRLIINNADPTIRTKQGLLASDIATTRDIIRTIKQTTRRGNTVHSRANSATSLRSFWEPPTNHSSYSDFSEATESDEYADSSSENEDNLEGGYLDMAVRVRKRHEARASTVSLVEVPETGEHGSMAAAAVAMANFKEQVQQLHQNLMQNLSALQDYQGLVNSLHSAQQRVSALIAGPPAYHDLFPGAKLDDKHALEDVGFDTKQASAIQAAADYEADKKCSTLYDGHQQTEQVEPPTVVSGQLQEKQIKKQLPDVLRIGRKNNITKEQQDNLRQAHAEKQKSLRSDHKLWLFWLPILLLICFTYFPTLFNVIWRLAHPSASVEAARQPFQRIVWGEIAN